MTTLADLFVRVLPDGKETDRYLARTETRLQKIDRTKITPKIEMSGADRTVGALTAKLQSLNKLKINLNVASTTAKAEVETLQRQLVRLTSKRSTVPIELQDDIDREIREVKGNLERLQRRETKLPMRLERINDQISAVTRQLNSIPDVDVDVDLDPERTLGRKLGGITKQVEDTGHKAGKGFGGGFNAGIRSIAGAAALLLSVSEVIRFLKESNAEARESQKVSAATAQLIKTTGGAANVTAGYVDQLTTSLSNKNGVDDEAIAKGANLLLTFKRVRNEAGEGGRIFDRANQAAVDLSATGFGSITTASKQLGKALQDPIKGTTALARAGVTFTDQQKEQITKMVEAGDILGAQKVILAEVESQVGGVGRASTTAGEKAVVAWDNFKELLGTALLPLVDKFSTFMLDKGIPALSSFVSFLSTNIPNAVSNATNTIEGFKEALTKGWERDTGTWGNEIIYAGLAIRKAFLPVVAFIRSEVVPRVASIGDAFSDLLTVLKPIAVQIGTAIQSVLSPKGGGGEAWTTIQDTIVSALVFIERTVRTVTKIISAVWAEHGDTITAVVKSNWSAVAGIVKGALSVLSGYLKLATSLMAGDWSGAWKGMRQVMKGQLDIITSIVKGVGKILGALVATAWSGMVDTVKFWMGRLVGFLAEKWSGIARGVTTGLSPIVGFVAGIWAKLQAGAASGLAAVAKVAKAALNAILLPFKITFTAIGTLIALTWGGIAKVTRAIWAKIGGDVRASTSAISKTISGWLSAARSTITATWNAIYSRVLAPVWNRIRSLFSSAMAAVRAGWDRFWSLIRSTATSAWNAVKDRVISPVWTRIRSIWTSAQTAVRSTWDSFWGRIKDSAQSAMNTVKSRIDTVLGKIRSAFSSAKTSIGKAWDGVKDKVSSPINWVKNNVYNKPLVPVWNRVAALVDGPTLKPYAKGGIAEYTRQGISQLEAYANGGTPYGVRPGYTPGRDTHLIGVGGGESIMRPEWTRAVGPALVHMWNRIARTKGVSGVRKIIGTMGVPEETRGRQQPMGGFADGGTVKGGSIADWLRSKIGGAASAVKGLASKLKGWALGGLKAAASKVLSPVRGLIDKRLVGNPVNRTVGSLGKKAISSVLDKIGSADDKAVAAMAPDTGGTGPFKGGGGAVGRGMAGIIRTARKFGIRSIGTYPGHHPSMARARDLMNTNVARGNALASALWGARKALNLWYIIWNRRIISQTRPGAGWTRYFDGGSSNPNRAHTNHLHVAVYRLGGIVNKLLGRSALGRAPVKLAAGGVVRGGRGGTIAHIGDGRHDELVTPLPKGWRAGAADDKIDRLCKLIEAYGLQGPVNNFGDILVPAGGSVAQTVNRELQLVANVGLV